MNAIDNIVERNEMLWKFLTEGDGMERADALTLIDRIWPSSSTADELEDVQ